MNFSICIFLYTVAIGIMNFFLHKIFLKDIPHFKEMIIMATDCDACGYKSNEVKAGRYKNDVITFIYNDLQLDFKVCVGVSLSLDRRESILKSHSSIEISSSYFKHCQRIKRKNNVWWVWTDSLVVNICICLLGCSISLLWFHVKSH